MLISSFLFSYVKDLRVYFTSNDEMVNLATKLFWNMCTIYDTCIGILFTLICILPIVKQEVNKHRQVMHR